MQIYKADLELLRTLESHAARSDISGPPVMGVRIFYDCEEKIVFREVKALQVNMFDDEGKEMGPWDWVECAFKEKKRDPDNTIRLAGPWLRHRFYTGTSPDGSGRLWVHNKKRGFWNVNRVSGDAGPLPGVRTNSPPDSQEIPPSNPSD